MTTASRDWSVLREIVSDFFYQCCFGVLLVNCIFFLDNRPAVDIRDWLHEFSEGLFGHCGWVAIVES
jgi:hypothetical protein